MIYVALELASKAMRRGVLGVLLIAALLAWIPVDLPAWGNAALCAAGVLTAIALFPGIVWVRRSETVSDHFPVVVRPLRWWVVALIAVGIAAMTWLALWWLMGLATQAQDSAKARIDAVRAALTLGAGLVGAVVLVLTARKQWLAEHAQRHTEIDAAEQRVTELYTSAADQLASEQAPVRMAGLYALERLAEGNPQHRQTIVNLFCAYLRMPYTPPEADTASTAAPITGRRRLGLRRPGRSRQEQSPLATLLAVAPELTAARRQLDAADQQQQELQVRLTAQRLLTQHLRPERNADKRVTNPAFWRDIDLDLTEATLVCWDFRNCEADSVTFSEACFHGPTWFDEAEFYDHALFSEAQFYGQTDFPAQFHGQAWFQEARFHGPVQFSDARFEEGADFTEAQFHKEANFSAIFHGRVDFTKAQFHRDVNFGETRFGSTDFTKAQFHRDVNFGETRFGSTDFTKAQFHRDVNFSEAWFRGGVWFHDTWFRTTPNLEGARARVHRGRAAQSVWPPEWTVSEYNRLDDVWWGMLVKHNGNQQGQDAADDSPSVTSAESVRAED